MSKRHHRGWVGIDPLDIPLSRIGQHLAWMHGAGVWSATKSRNHVWGIKNALIHAYSAHLLWRTGRWQGGCEGLACMVKAASKEELQEVMWAAFNFGWSTGRLQVGGVPSHCGCITGHVHRLACTSLRRENGDDSSCPLFGSYLNKPCTWAAQILEKQPNWAKIKLK